MADAPSRRHCQGHGGRTKQAPVNRGCFDARLAATSWPAGISDELPVLARGHVGIRRLSLRGLGIDSGGHRQPTRQTCSLIDSCHQSPKCLAGIRGRRHRHENGNRSATRPRYLGRLVSGPPLTYQALEHSPLVQSIAGVIIRGLPLAHRLGEKENVYSASNRNRLPA